MMVATATDVLGSASGADDEKAYDKALKLEAAVNGLLRFAMTSESLDPQGLLEYAKDIAYGHWIPVGDVMKQLRVRYTMRVRSDEYDTSGVSEAMHNRLYDPTL